MTLDQMRSHLAAVSYMPGWTLELVEGSLMDEGHQLRVRAEVANAYRPNESVPLDIWTYLPPMDTPAQFDRWLAWRLSRIQIHEGLEWLQRNGKPIFDPHEVNA